MQKGLYQHLSHKFQQRNICCGGGGGRLRRFNPTWFKEFGNWFEYSIEKYVFCLCCYLFRKQAGGDIFVMGGFTSWNKNEGLIVHVGDNKLNDRTEWIF